MPSPPGLPCRWSSGAVEGHVNRIKMLKRRMYGRARLLRQRRLVLAQEARLLGHGRVRAVALMAGVSETTVRNGVFELEAGGDPFPGGRVRRPGGGRRAAEDQDPQLMPVLGLVEPDERGDPVSPLRWTTKSLRSLAGELTRQGHPSPHPHSTGCCASTASACKPGAARQQPNPGRQITR
jgi:hypothetical protein